MESPNARIPIGLVEHFLERNRVNILDQWRDFYRESCSGSRKEKPAVVTVSHFASNQQCLPDWKDLNSETFRDHWLDHGAGTCGDWDVGVSRYHHFSLLLLEES